MHQNYIYENSSEAMLQQYEYVEYNNNNEEQRVFMFLTGMHILMYKVLLKVIKFPVSFYSSRLCKSFPLLFSYSIRSKHARHFLGEFQVRITVNIIAINADFSMLLWAASVQHHIKSPIYATFNNRFKASTLPKLFHLWGTNLNLSKFISLRCPFS